MSILPILLYGDPRLEQKAESVVEIGDEIRELAKNMALTMYAAPGVGLAAPQVGVAKRMLVIDVSGGDEEGKLQTFINPEITYREGLVRDDEGCLSFPDIVEIVERPAIVSCRALGLDGREFTVERADGLLARAICHEIDHLDGVLLTDRVNAFRRAMIKKKVRRKVKAGEWVAEPAHARAAAL
ncbi:MAG: peptide deformylase [Acidobacteriota bacterium]